MHELVQLEGPFFKEEGTQTLDRGIIAMPLESHVPNRSKILYSLWRAGYRFDICEYSERVRVEFEGLVGAWLARVRMERFHRLLRLIEMYP